MGVDYIQFHPMLIHRGKNFEYDWQAVTKDIKQWLQYSDKGFDVLYSKHKYDMMKRSDFGRDYGKCFGHQFATEVSATGKMYICCHLVIRSNLDVLG